MPLTKRCLEVLRLMQRAEDEDRLEDAELVRDGGLFYWLDCDQIHVRTVRRLLCVTALRSVGDTEVEHYVLNDTGRAILRRPELADEVAQALDSQRAFTIQNDKVVPLTRRGTMPTKRRPIPKTPFDHLLSGGCDCGKHP